METLALHTNIKLGSKWLTLPNALTYYNSVLINGIKIYSIGHRWVNEACIDKRTNLLHTAQTTTIKSVLLLATVLGLTNILAYSTNILITWVKFFIVPATVLAITNTLTYCTVVLIG